MELLSCFLEAASIILEVKREPETAFTWVNRTGGELGQENWDRWSTYEELGQEYQDRMKNGDKKIGTDGVLGQNGELAQMENWDKRTGTKELGLVGTGGVLGQMSYLFQHLLEVVVSFSGSQLQLCDEPVYLVNN